MKTLRIAIVLLLLSLAFAVNAEAQQCVASDTPVTCWQRFVPSVEVHVDEAETLVASVPSTPSLRDFVSVLSGSVRTSMNGGNAMTFDVNLPSPLGGDARKLKLQVVVTDPQLDEGLAEVESLQEELNVADDVAGSLSYNLATRSLGRSIAPHRDFFDSLVQVAYADTSASDRARRAAIVAANITEADARFDTIADVTARAAAIRAFEASARATRAALDDLSSMTTAFARLLNNQPQLYGTVLYHYRGELVGPSEYGAKVTYELGSRNLNAFYRKHGKCAPAADCEQRLRDFAADASRGNRLSFALEHRRRDAQRLDLPQHGLVLETPSDANTIASVIAGFTPRIGPIDLGISYDEDRVVGSLTYTRKITDSLSIPISLVFANREQYLSHVNRKLNAHFGIVYKLPM